MAITTEVCNHTSRGTGIIAYLENGGTVEKARQMAAHASARTTQLYVRCEDRVTFDEVVKINIRGRVPPGKCPKRSARWQRQWWPRC